MKRTAILPICLVLAVLLSGCSAPRPRASLAGVEVETVSTGSVTVSRAEAFPADDGLRVTGTLRRMHEVTIPGHVDIILCGPEGVLETRSVAVPGLSSKRRGLQELGFAARFEQLPPAGSTVQVRYHASPCGDGSGACS